MVIVGGVTVILGSVADLLVSTSRAVADPLTPVSRAVADLLTPVSRAVADLLTPASRAVDDVFIPVSRVAVVNVSPLGPRGEGPGSTTELFILLTFHLFLLSSALQQSAFASWTFEA